MVKIVKVAGLNGLDKTQGCEKAPALIIEELGKIKLNEKGEELDASNFVAEEIAVDNNNAAQANELIFEGASEILDNTDEKTLFVGGDHSISYSLCRAFFQKYPKGYLIVFDAHADLMPPMKEPTHEEWLRALIESGTDASRVILCGARKFELEELKYLQEKGIKYYSINQIIQDIGEFCEIVMESTQLNPVYVSIDIDAVDPAFAPATGYGEIGGLTSRQMLYIAGRLSYLKQLKAADIVEINPEKAGKQGAEMTVKLGAKLIAEFL